MTPAATMQRKAVRRAAIIAIRTGLGVLAILTLRRTLLRLLAAGDEGWKPLDIFVICRLLLRTARLK